MVKIYAALIVKGRKTIEDVPDALRDMVIAELEKRGWFVTRTE